ncbi:geranylgeranylglyceryl phosphate synthase [Sulfurisphaera tokodaii str. 7]|uniref:Geranylgeranylglyceryl phosphate synthase n=1 Tax=Sulfurisphaera tokodaii (strain DSM 16993 / JCM 10545 / NBRC 100140 / 7) TaxID=273063 RepID=GGGPS_SULTO|nr:RecName: Full=Geranylgeranylglyceryl phosphate synthase; Short=GGGP synthase; Short=GGGPS; AltName: Full=(S)-3-O-geranylgeranylglyceryl phosphate synthase; AltName: Full=Phosphoglycerol geranylgeranyltransferase [Sulfurisphaera tokodaii str. 7]BAK54230.1 geranylgeranylglyceryl phosphate synthase [Sulfurisphaera tokodaii str. 7]
MRKIIQEKLNEGKVLHFSLFDPDKVDLESIYSIALKLVESGTSGFLIGGTLGVSKEKLDSIIEILEDFEVPKIIFPSNVNLITEKADAILFMSLLNSDDIYYITGAQLIAAPIIKKLKLESLPTGYIIVGHGGTAAHVGKARVIPYDNIELIVAYSIMAELFGMDFVYLEAGSGAPEPIRPSVISITKKYLENSKIIVGGGIRNEEIAKELALAGADIIVTGNIIEQNLEKALKIVKEISNIRR